MRLNNKRRNTLNTIPLELNLLASPVKNSIPSSTKNENNRSIGFNRVSKIKRKFFFRENNFEKRKETLMNLVLLKMLPNLYHNKKVLRVMLDKLQDNAKSYKNVFDLKTEEGGKKRGRARTPDFSREEFPNNSNSVNLDNTSQESSLDIHNSLNSIPVVTKKSQFGQKSRTLKVKQKFRGIMANIVEENCENREVNNQPLTFSSKGAQPTKQRDNNYISSFKEFEDSPQSRNIIDFDLQSLEIDTQEDGELFPSKSRYWSFKLSSPHERRNNRKLFDKGHCSTKEINLLKKPKKSVFHVNSSLNKVKTIMKIETNLSCQYGN